MSLNGWRCLAPSGVLVKIEWLGGLDDETGDALILRARLLLSCGEE